jgi:hypothetical protein
MDLDGSPWVHGWKYLQQFLLITCRIKIIYHHFDDAVGSSGYMTLQCRTFSEELIERL